jgi:hypothetical protein
MDPEILKDARPELEQASAEPIQTSGKQKRKQPDESAQAEGNEQGDEPTSMNVDAAPTGQPIDAAPVEEEDEELSVWQPDAVDPETAADDKQPTKKAKGDSGSPTTKQTQSATTKLTQYWYKIYNQEDLPDESDTLEETKYMMFVPPPLSRSETGDWDGASDTTNFMVLREGQWKSMRHTAVARSNDFMRGWRTEQGLTIKFLGSSGLLDLWRFPSYNARFRGLGNNYDLVDFWDEAFARGQALSRQLKADNKLNLSCFEVFDDLTWTPRKSMALGQYPAKRPLKDSRIWGAEEKMTYFRLKKPKALTMPTTASQRYVKLRGGNVGNDKGFGRKLYEGDISAPARKIDPNAMYVTKDMMQGLIDGTFDLSSTYNRLYFRDMLGATRYLFITDKWSKDAWKTGQAQALRSLGGGFGRCRNVQGLELIMVVNDPWPASELQKMVTDIIQKYKDKGVAEDQQTTATVLTHEEFDKRADKSDLHLVSIPHHNWQ